FSRRPAAGATRSEAYVGVRCIRRASGFPLSLRPHQSQPGTERSMQVRRSTVLSAAVLGTLALSALPVPAQVPPGGGLSLAEAVSMAQENNPGYLTQQNQLRTARWNVRSAYGSWLPSVNVSNSFGYTAEGE